MAQQSCCQGSFWSRAFSKVGRCPKCMRLSLAGMAVAWLIAGLLYFFGPASWVWGLALIPALSFTALTVAHVAAFMSRVMVAVEEDPEEEGGDTVAPEYDAGRRAFLTRSLGVSLAALVAALFGPINLAEAGHRLYCRYRVAVVLEPAGSPCHQLLAAPCYLPALSRSHLQRAGQVPAGPLDLYDLYRWRPMYGPATTAKQAV